MRELGADIDVVRLLLDGVEIVSEAFPGPAQPFVQGRARNVLDAFHQFDEAVVVGFAHRRETDAAIAHHDGGHAMPARRIEPRIPRRLPVIVRVDVDEARRDELAARIDLLAARTRDLPDARNLAVGDGDIGRENGASFAVCDGAAPNDEVVLGGHGASPGYCFVNGLPVLI